MRIDQHIKAMYALDAEELYDIALAALTQISTRLSKAREPGFYACNRAIRELATAGAELKDQEGRTEPKESP